MSYKITKGNCLVTSWVNTGNREPNNQFCIIFVAQEPLIVFMVQPRTHGNTTSTAHTVKTGKTSL